MKKVIAFLCSIICFYSCSHSSQQNYEIDRKALVTRHNIVVTQFDTLSSLTIGNGSFAFTVDATGLQTFPAYYRNGVTLGTQSDWGWHSFPNPHHYTLKDIMKEYEYYGRKVPYAYASDETPREQAATKWLRSNPHRLDLGKVGFHIIKSDGTPATMDDFTNIHQKLNLWTGIVHSHFEVEGVPVDVQTVSHQQRDLVSVRVQSPLIAQDRLKVTFRFPYAAGKWDRAFDWNSPDKHQTILHKKNKNQSVIEHVLGDTRYYVTIDRKSSASIEQKKNHTYDLAPSGEGDTFTFSFQFTSDRPDKNTNLGFHKTKKNSISQWKHFWTTGGAIDLSQSTDPRAMELERRIVLSQYLTKVNSAGPIPPQETGLVYNSWYGKFHLEMHLWHAAQFALWNRIELLEKSLGWYKKIKDQARDRAKRQGFKGVRWPKMVGPSGRVSPSSVGPFIIWQQPHIIYFAELIYRANANQKTLEKYKDLVFATAKFMADFVHLNKKTGEYVLGPVLIPAQESLPKSTINPTFGLAYWYWGLSTAQKWRERLGLPRKAKWDSVLKNLSPLPVKSEVYLAAENAPDSYTNPEYMSDHPSVLMGLSFLPKTKIIDLPTMRRTFEKVVKVWDWPSTWGWDYPMMAMTATRLGKPKKAIDILMKNVTKNTYLPNGYNYQSPRLRVYLPGNGALLMAVAMMCTGWDGYQGPPTPGFPDNGKWVVHCENFNKIP